MSSIIQVTNLSTCPVVLRQRRIGKSYTITHEGKERYTALRDVMAQKVKKIFSLPRSRGEVQLISLPRSRGEVKLTSLPRSRGEVQLILLPRSRGEVKLTSFR